MKLYIVSILFGLLLGASVHADSMRCGQHIVNETATIAELLSKCGEPKTKDVQSQDVLARNRDTGLMYKVGTKITERWIYQRSNRALPMAVTIVDGKIIRLERTE